MSKPNLFDETRCATKSGGPGQIVGAWCAILVVSAAVIYYFWMPLLHAMFSGSEGSKAQAQAAPELQPLVIPLPAGQKFVSVGWRCYAGGSGCDLWHATQPMQPDDLPMTTTFRNRDGTETIVFSETRNLR